ncbi:MAG: energy-coupling factor transporter transmembrane protein EcfT [Oscillospiraceae bacterium]|nr:energy-coupling factor transporter transmembrane protein EcfT [Oscillospiraceae bacterium]
MLKDITLGQYFPMDSVVHRMDARYKIIITMVFLVMLFWGQHLTSLLAGLLFVAVAMICSKIPPKMLLKSIKPIVPVLVITGVLNLFLLSGGKVLWEWKFIKLTEQGVQTSVFMLVRICLLIAGTSLLTYTTSPIVLTDAIESLLSPLKKLKMPVHELAMMMTIALRFIPTLIEETDKIMAAQKARGADMESGSLIQRAQALVPILIPLFVSAFRRAEELALAMECRCYHGGEGRTRLRQLKSGLRDYVALGLTLLLFAAVITLNTVLH